MESTKYRKYLILSVWLLDISQNTDILDKGERQKADNISGLLGERSFTVKAVADEQEWTMIRKLYPEFTQGYFWGKPCGYEEFIEKFTGEFTENRL